MNGRTLAVGAEADQPEAFKTALSAARLIIALRARKRRIVLLFLDIFGLRLKYQTARVAFFALV